MTELSHARLKELLSYNRRTGLFRWRKKRNGIRPDRQAGSPSGHGYISIMIDGVSYGAHNLAWFYVTGEWPPRRLDHRDLVKGNNRWRNLRLATGSQNSANIRARSSSGFKGVYERRGRTLAKPFQATITVEGKFHHLGYFSTAKLAGAAYMAAAQHHFGEFARGS